MKNSLYLLIIIIFFISSGGLLFSKINKPGNSNQYITETRSAFAQIGDFLNNLGQNLSQSKTKSDSFPLSTPSSLPEPEDITQDIENDETNLDNIDSQSSLKVTINGKEVVNKTTKSNNSQPKSCYRFTVPHLDGSSSNLCYSQTDHNQLSSLYSQYSSTKANYDFEVRVAKMYTEAKETAHNPDFYQPSIDEANRKAQEHKDKMGEIALKMYNIESRGW